MFLQVTPRTQASQSFLTHTDPFYTHRQHELGSPLPGTNPGSPLAGHLTLSEALFVPESHSSVGTSDAYLTGRLCVFDEVIHVKCSEQYLAWNRCTVHCVRLVFPHIQTHSTNSSKYTFTNPVIIFTSCFVYLEWFQCLPLFQNSQSIASFLSTTKAWDVVLRS